MADIFLSYRNLPDRRALVERLAAILEANGLDVWWDYGLEAGASYRDQILRELTDARIVAPLWCAASIESQWVHMEAEFGKDKLVPARLQNVAPPVAFEATQAADLIGWDGRVDHDPLERFRRSGAFAVHGKPFLTRRPERANMSPMADTLTINLQPETAAQLRRVASETGESLEALAHRLLTEAALPPSLLSDAQLEDLKRRIADPGPLATDAEVEALFAEFEPES